MSLAAFSSVLQKLDGRFICLLFSTYWGLKGAQHLYLSSVQLPFYIRKNINGTEYQILQSIASVPFGLKGIVGVLSDKCPLGRRRKAPYALLFTIIGSTSALVLAKFYQVVPAKGAALLFFACHLHIAALDLLCEGKYAELMKKHRSIKSNIVSCVWMFVNLGALMGSLTVGWLTDRYGFEWVLWLSLFLSLQSFVPLMYDPFPEDHVPSFSSLEAIHRENVPLSAEETAARKMVMAALMMTMLSLAYVVVALTQTHVVLLSYSLLASFFFCLAVFASMPPLVARANLFLFLQDALHINLNGPLDRWYIAPKSCVPNGPEFSLTFYQTYAITLSIASSWVGIYVWNAYFKRWNVRTLFVLMIGLRVISSVFDLLLIVRVNVTYLHIPDSIFFLMGDAVIIPMISMLGFLPAVILTSKMCPDHMESTAYAILAGCQNFGHNVARAIGLALADLGGIQTQEPNCDFSGLPRIVVIGHILAPMLCLFLINKLLPLSSEAVDGSSKEDSLISSVPSNLSVAASIEMQPLLMQRD